MSNFVVIVYHEYFCELDIFFRFWTMCLSNNSYVGVYTQVFYFGMILHLIFNLDNAYPCDTISYC